MVEKLEVKRRVGGAQERRCGGVSESVGNRRDCYHQLLWIGLLRKDHPSSILNQKYQYLTGDIEQLAFWSFLLQGLNEG